MKPGHRFLIVTNNPLVRDCLSDWYQIDYQEISFREILVKVRDLVYMGHELYTHPIAGSVKPNETPYKSIVIDFQLIDYTLLCGALDVDAIAGLSKVNYQKII